MLASTPTEVLEHAFAGGGEMGERVRGERVATVLLDPATGRLATLRAGELEDDVALLLVRRT